ncbi:MAG: alpha/beta hydrolase family protein, partial [Woeseiaceae bacterium]
YVAHLYRVHDDYFIEHSGTLVQKHVVDASIRSDGTRIIDVDLRSNSGLTVSMRVLLPPEAATQQVALLLMLGGHRTGKGAVDLIDEPRGIAYAAIDYPYSGRHRLAGFRQVVAAIPGIQSAFLDTPPALMLALDWLLRQPWADPGRAELVGASLGVPFAAVAGALDQRFTRIWLVHGAADNYLWVMHAVGHGIDNELLRGLAARMALLLVYGNSFRTDEWIREIPPRRLGIIAARDDERVPEAAIAAFVHAAESEHVQLIWTEGRHVDPGRDDELGQLIDIVVGEVAATDSSRWQIDGPASGPQHPGKRVAE